MTHLLRLTLAMVIVALFSSLSEAQYVSPTGHGGEGLTDSSYTVAQSMQSPGKLARVKGGKVKNVILFISDGTSLPQITAAQHYAVGRNGRLNLQRLPVTGFAETHSADNLITDSAAGGTAYSTGQKTRNGMIAMSPDSVRLKTLLELAEEQGKSTGLVVTSSITHATPAVFASHVVDRGMAPTIAEQMIRSGADVLLGGGKHFFVPQTVEGSRRKDDRDLLDEARERGYQFVEKRDALINAKSDKLLGLFQMGAMKTEAPEPSLAEMTQKAIDVLSKNKKGFFLMVEGSQVDWGGHDNNVAYVIDELLEFDQAVKVGSNFAVQSGNTLIVVTADHETGGLTLDHYDKDSSKMDVSYTTSHHTALPVPVLAYGPGSEEFTGVFDNTEIGRMLAQLMDISNFPQEFSSTE